MNEKPIHKTKVPKVVLEYFELAGQIETTKDGESSYFLPIVIDGAGVVVTPSKELKEEFKRVIDLL